MANHSLSDLEEYAHRKGEMSIEDILAQEDDAFLCDGVFTRILDVRGDNIPASELSAIERTIICIWQTHGIIGNGGFQYLFEASFRGDSGFIYTAAGLEVIDCRGASAAFKRALALFPFSKPHADIPDRLTHYRTVPKETRDEIDRLFWAASADLEEKLASFIRFHREELMALKSGHSHTQSSSGRRSPFG